MVPPPTGYFPLIVEGALRIEPTETETEAREGLRRFADAMIAIVRVAATDPQSLHNAPLTVPIRRLDETAAARPPYLPWAPKREHGE